MTFDARETSTQDGAPVELYTFALADTVWRYTSADRDVTLLSSEFLARPISRTDIESTHESARLAISLTVPRTLEVADLYRISPPTQAVTLIVQQYHDGDGELATLWTGRVLGVEFAGMNARMALEPAFTGIRRIGLHRLYQRQCPHVLYGNACGASRETHRVDGVVDTVAGFVVSVPEADALADSHFAGGYLEFDAAGGYVERRFITDHAGANLTLSSSPYGLEPGAAVKLYPGCDHAIATCVSKFANQANYGGFPYFPQRNPFGGDPVF